MLRSYLIVTNPENGKVWKKSALFPENTPAVEIVDTLEEDLPLDKIAAKLDCPALLLQDALYDEAIVTIDHIFDAE